MDSKIEHALSEIAYTLGITTNQLYDWANSDALNQYAKTQAIKYIGLCCFCSLVVLVCIGIFIWCLVKIKKDGVDIYDFDMWFFCLLVFGGVAIIGLLITFPEAVGWLCYPKGMIIKMFATNL